MSTTILGSDGKPRCRWSARRFLRFRNCRGKLPFRDRYPYLPGTDLGKMPLTPELLRNLGSAVAQLGKALRGFCHPAARHELLWDLQQAPRMRAYTSTIAGKADRERVERVLDDFIANVLPGLARLRAQIIHHDANGDNVVVSPDAPDQIAGIVDFGDMIHTALAADPAVTAADLLDGRGHR